MMPAHRPEISRGKSVSALGMCLLMVLVSLSAMVPPLLSLLLKRWLGQSTTRHNQTKWG